MTKRDATQLPIINQRTQRYVEGMRESWQYIIGNDSILIRYDTYINCAHLKVDQEFLLKNFPSQYSPSDYIPDIQEIAVGKADEAFKKIEAMYERRNKEEG